jgi:hypothetical protein
MPFYAAVGDFNGDGIPDLAISNSGDDTLTIALGNGDGTFTTKSTLTFSFSPFGLAVGDFNGDGIPDLAVSGYLSGVGSVAVLLGNGDGTFTTRSTISDGETPLSVAVGDFNGDGIPDLVTADAVGNAVTVLLGNGDGTFTTGSTFVVGSFPYSVAVGDFNGDGIPDLAVANVNDNTVSVLLGNGDGTFTTKSTPAAGGHPLSVVVGDFNGDGIPDLATANNTGNTITVLLGNGDGTFTLKSTPAVGSSPDSVAIGDFNGDGIPDIATSSTVLLGNGDGTFAAQPLPSTGDSNTVTVGDFNGDGAPDIAMSSGTVLLNEFLATTATAALNNVSVSGSSTDQVEATYPGDTNFASSTSSSVSLLATPVATTLELSSSANPSMYGYLVTFTATLSPYSSAGFTTNGDTVTFYSGGKSIGTGALSSGVATFSVAGLAAGTYSITATFSGDGNFATSNSNSVTQLVNPIPNSAIVVTTNTDNTTGVAANCTAGGSANCSLRDALTAAAAGGGNIIFDPAVFGTPQTISIKNGSLNVPSNTAIIGPTTGSGASLSPLVTVSGTPTTNGGSPNIIVDAGVVNAAISGLVISNGEASGCGMGLYNAGSLTLSDSLITHNTLVEGYGAGLCNDTSGTLTVLDSTISGNESGIPGYITDVSGAGAFNHGTMTMINSTVSGNSSNNGGGCGGICSDGKLLTIINSTITGNNNSNGGTGAGIYGATVTNSIVAGNSTDSAEDDCDGSGCPTNGTNGNVVGAVSSSLAPGSPAICAGLLANIPNGITTDQRGAPRTTTYSTPSGNVTCVDAGAIQTHYALAFTQQPPATIGAGENFSAAVQLSESAAPYQFGGIAINALLNGTGTLSNPTASTDVHGAASFSNLQVSAAGTGDTITASLPVTTTPPPASLTSPLSVSATSTPFDVTGDSQTITFPALSSPVTFGVAPITLRATASSSLAVSYSATGPGTISGSTLTITGAGTVVVTASQTGNATYAAATPVSQSIVVNQAASATALTSSNTNANLNAPVTFTAIATSTAGTPTGGVQFLDGTTPLGTSVLNAQGVATYVISTLAAGSHSINAIYMGDSNFASSQAALTQLVTAPGFSISASPASLSLKAGQTGIIQITLTPVGGYAGSLSIACTGLPQLSTCSFSPASLTADGSNMAVSTTMTITTTGSNQGTVSELNMVPLNPPGATALLCWLPGCFIGFVLSRKRKQLSRSVRNAMWVLVLAACVSGMAACGGGGMSGSSSGGGKSTTPAGSSTITVTVSGTGSVSQTLTVDLTVTQ